MKKRIFKDISNIFYSNFKKQSFGKFHNTEFLEKIQKTEFWEKIQKTEFWEKFSRQSLKYI